MFGGWKCSVFHTNHHKKILKRSILLCYCPKFWVNVSANWTIWCETLKTMVSLKKMPSKVIHCEFSLEKELDFKQHLWLRHGENALQSRRSMVYLCALVWCCTLICCIAQKHFYLWIVSHFHTTDSIAMHRIILHSLLFHPESHK